MSKVTISTCTILLAITLALGYAGDFLSYFPKFQSDTYLFAINDKRINKLKFIAIPEQEENLDNLKSIFEKKGFRVGIVPEDLIARTLATGMMDCSVSTSIELFSEIKNKFPSGIIISLFPEAKILKP